MPSGSNLPWVVEHFVPVFLLLRCCFGAENNLACLENETVVRGGVRAGESKDASNGDGENDDGRNEDDGGGVN